jgi:hypothetical protein
MTAHCGAILLSAGAGGLLTYARAVMALVQISTERELRLRATLNLMGLRVRVHIHLPIFFIIDRV